MRGLLVAILLLGACLTALATDSLIGRKAPEFTRKDLTGNTVDLGRMRGKVVLLNFWATWCAPCEIEMPAFVEWQRQYGGQGLQVVGVSMDDDVAPVRRLAAKLKLNYPVAMGDEDLGALYGGVLGLPLTYLIDGDGVVRARFQGESDLKAIEAQVKELLDRR
jgi:peroxiredoxin